MRHLFIIEDSLTNKISYYHAILFLLSLPFDRFYSLILLISFAIHTLLHLRKKIFADLDNRIWILQSVFYIAVLGALYSPAHELALSEITKKLAVFLFPLIFYLNPIDLNKYKNHLMLFFTLSCTLAIIYLFADALHIIYYNTFPLSTLFTSLFTNQNFSEPIMMHATFLSMYTALALVCVLTKLIRSFSIRNKIVYGIMLIILSGGLFQLSSKSVFFAMLLIINGAFPFFVMTGNNRKKFIAVSMLLSLIAALVILKVDSFRTRYLTDLKFDLTNHTENRITDSRMERWNIAINLIKEKPVLGYGTGSEIPLLQEQYFENKLYSAFLHGLNAHNQYLSFLLKTGFIGLSIYIYTLFFGFKQAVRSHDILFFSFMVLISVVSLSENLLDVNKGIFFYTVFFTLFTFSASLNRREPVDPDQIERKRV